MARTILCLGSALSLVLVAYAVDYASDPAVQLFQRYVRMNTTTNGNLTPAVEFWTELAKDLNLTLSKYEYVTGYPVLVIYWPGKDSSLPSIMLNSHMDVVPVDPAVWTYPPFSATLDDNNTIWGRGTQDMKSVAIQYYLALKKLKEHGVELLRDVYTTYMPDEETGGLNGMVRLLESPEFTKMNVGVEIDEGAAWPQDASPFLYEDKSVWQFVITCRGPAVHSSTFPASNTTAVGKCRNVMDLFLNFREQQYQIALNGTILHAGPFTNVNLNKINAGTAANNIIPPEVNMTFDVRPAIDMNLTVFEEQINAWLAASGPNVTISYVLKEHQAAETVHNSSNPYYTTIMSAATKLDLTLIPIVAPGGTDGRFVRLKKIPAFGFAPMRLNPILAHTDDERLSAKTFVEGIDVYYEILQDLANIPASDTDGIPPGSLVIQSPY